MENQNTSKKKFSFKKNQKWWISLISIIICAVTFVIVFPLFMSNNYTTCREMKTTNLPGFGNVIANCVIVVSKAGIPDSRINEIIKEINGRVESQKPQSHIWRISLPRAFDSSNIIKAINKLQTFPEIDGAAPIGIMSSPK